MAERLAYMCFDVRVGVGDSGEVSPAALQSLNVAVLYTVLHSFFKKSIDAWNIQNKHHKVKHQLNWNNVSSNCINRSTISVEVFVDTNFLKLKFKYTHNFFISKPKTCQTSGSEYILSH